MTAVAEAWARIERWLHEHTPKSEALLAGPAAPEAIAVAETRLGVAFPAELVESLLRHDGLTEWDNLLPETTPIGLGEIVEHYEIRMDVAADVDGFAVHEPNSEPWWHELWLPFGDAEGDLQVIDMRPGPQRGRLGSAPHDNPADFSDAWPSLSAYLSAVAGALEQGAPCGVWHPYITEDETLWWDLAGKEELNGEPLRPASCRAG
ncbi:SMI1/KNR4 family protein [Actinoplanes sp. NPDC000266]